MPRLSRLKQILSIIIPICAVVRYGYAQENAYAPAAISESPAVITLDFAREKGMFNKQLFSAMDAPFEDRQGYDLLKESHFALVGNMDRDINPQKTKAIAEYGFETLVFYDQKMPMGKGDLERNAQEFLDRVDSLKKMYPGFDVHYIIFANEPDLPFPPGGFPPGLSPFWTGTMDELFHNYEAFATYLKLKKPEILVGGLGFASAGSRVWIEAFLDYVDKNNVPLDFLPYHCYASGLKPYIEGLNVMEERLNAHPRLHPKLAVTELDIRALIIPNDRPYPEMDTAWKAAHNILAMLFLADRGVWMAIDYGGPMRDPNGMAQFLWVKPDGTKKPVYYAHKAFNELRGTIQIAQEGSNFQTFGVGAGKSQDNNSLTVVIAGFDQYSLLPHLTDSHPPQEERDRQSRDLPVYKKYSLVIKNLPWNETDTLVMERYAVDDTHDLILLETRELQGASQLSINKDIGLPQVQLIKISMKRGEHGK